MTTTPHDRQIHQGRNIKKFREMLGIKQEALALELGDDWSQKKVSQLEAKEQIDDAILEQVSKVLRIPKETLENLDAQEAVVNIQNNYENHDNTSNTQVANQYNFNPIEKIMELYERMLKQHETLIERLEQLLKEK